MSGAASYGCAKAVWQALKLWIPSQKAVASREQRTDRASRRWYASPAAQGGLGGKDFSQLSTAKQQGQNLHTRTMVHKADSDKQMHMQAFALFHFYKIKQNCKGGRGPRGNPALNHKPFLLPSAGPRSLSKKGLG